LSGCSLPSKDSGNSKVVIESPPPTQVKVPEIKNPPNKCKSTDDHFQEFRALLSERRDLLGKDFCQVEDALRQNKQDVDEWLEQNQQDVEPSECEKIQTEYNTLRAQSSELDREIKRVSRFCPQECPTADGVVSIFEIENNDDDDDDDSPTLFIHQAQSQNASKFTTEQRALNQVNGEKYYLRIISQMRRSASVFVVGIPRDNNTSSLLFQVYCCSGGALASNYVIPFSEIGTHLNNININARVSASLGSDAFALKIAPTKILLWSAIEQKYVIITATNPVMAITLGRDNETGLLRLIYLDKMGNIVFTNLEKKRESIRVKEPNLVYYEFLAARVELMEKYPTLGYLRRIMSVLMSWGGL
jgi:hypothetical protein